MKKNDPTTQLIENLVYLKLPWTRENYEALAAEAVQKNWTPAEFLCRLVEGETNLRMNRAMDKENPECTVPGY